MQIQQSQEQQQFAQKQKNAEVSVNKPSNFQKSNYQIFLQWFQQNGGLYDKQSILFPATFQPTDYVGIVATNNIKANKVIMAVPYNLIIGVSTVRNSPLSHILKHHHILNDPQNQDCDFNILTLFLIHEKMKGKESYYYPYFQAVDNVQTMIDWTNQQIRNLKDPFINVKYIQQIRQQFVPVYSTFSHIVKQNPMLFSEELTYDFFIECYSFVMTRCFGWAMPQTMLIPFADFLNHDCHGVNHYMFSRYFQEHDHSYYIKKDRELDLTLLGIRNTQKLPKGYQPNAREMFVQKNMSILEKKGVQYDVNLRLTPQITNRMVEIIQKQLLTQNKVQEALEVPLLLSSDSQDNDTQSQDSEQSSEQQNAGQKMREQGQGWERKPKRIDINLIKILKKSKDPFNQYFDEPKPMVSRQFDSGVNFDWWSQHKQQNYFIIATDRNTFKGQQIYNSYGQRNNRFLLPWYGFSLQVNKYDSVPFRIWNDRVKRQTGQYIHCGFITQKQVTKGIFISISDTLISKKYTVNDLTKEFRLKLSSVSLELIVFLRFQLMRKIPKYVQMYKQRKILIQKPCDILLQIEVMEKYGQILSHLSKKYKIDQERPIPSVNSQRKMSRIFFRQNLVQSNKQIITSHFHCIKILKDFLLRCSKGQTLRNFYENIFQYHCQQNPQRIFQFKKRLLSYIRMVQEIKYD